MRQRYRRRHAGRAVPKACLLYTSTFEKAALLFGPAEARGTFFSILIPLCRCRFVKLPGLIRVLRHAFPPLIAAGQIVLAPGVALPGRLKIPLRLSLIHISRPTAGWSWRSCRNPTAYPRSAYRRGRQIHCNAWPLRPSHAVPQ